VRLVLDRVASNYNRDADVFLLGLGYRWPRRAAATAEAPCCPIGRTTRPQVGRASRARPLPHSSLPAGPTEAGEKFPIPLSVHGSMAEIRGPWKRAVSKLLLTPITYL